MNVNTNKSIHIELQDFPLTKNDANNNDNDNAVIFEETKFSFRVSQETLEWKIEQNQHLFTRKSTYIAKIGLFVAAVAFVLLGEIYGTPSDNTPCIEDPVINLTTEAANFLKGNNDIAMSLQYVYGVAMDAVFYVTFIYWVINAKNARFLVVVLMYFAFRYLNSKMYTFKLPDGNVWNNLSSYSLTGYIYKGTDFLYSGHIGFLNICAMEWFELGYKKLSYVIWVIMCYTAFLFMLFQIHYMVDILTALFFSHYCFLIVNNHLMAIEKFGMAVFAQVQKALQTKGKYWRAENVEPDN